MKPRNPDFLIIGAMKAGTTSLADALSHHPEIFVTQQKEVHQFHQGEVSESQLQDYRKHFQSEKTRVGSAPQGYSKAHLPLVDQVPQALKRFFPDLKLIYIVREPIARMVSHFQEHFSQDQRGHGKLVFHPEVNPELWQHWLMTSSYGFQLNRFLEHFDKRQLLVLRLEDFADSGQVQFDKVCDFLSVERHQMVMSRKNTSAQKFYLSPFMNLMLQGENRLSRRLRILAFDLGTKHRLLKKLLLQPALQVKLSPDIEQSLSTYFHQDVEATTHKGIKPIIRYH